MKSEITYIQLHEELKADMKIRLMEPLRTSAFRGNFEKRVVKPLICVMFIFLASGIFAEVWSDGNILIVTENLRLRNSQEKTSKIITTMQAGTPVMVIDTGKIEKIDGIFGNWVRVRVLSDSKQNEETSLSKDIVGWCFGGYLTKAIPVADIENILLNTEFFDKYHIYKLTFSKEDDSLYCTRYDMETEFRKKYTTSITSGLIQIHGLSDKPYTIGDEPVVTAQVQLYQDGKIVYGSDKPQNGSMVIHEGIKSIVHHQVYQVIKKQRWYVQPDESSESPAIRRANDFNEIGYKIPASREVLPGETVSVLARTTEKLPYEKKEGYWFLIEVNSIERENPLFWVFEESLVSYKEQVITIYDKALFFESMKTSGGIPFTDEDWNIRHNARGYDSMRDIYQRMEW